MDYLSFYLLFSYVIFPDKYTEHKEDCKHNNLNTVQWFWIEGFSFTRKT